MTTKPELLPCPFCGGKVEVFLQIRPDAWVVKCFNDGCNADCGHETQEEAIKQWNRRSLK